MLMPFGMHTGADVCDLPLNYMKWCLRTIDDLDERHPGLRDALELEVARRSPGRQHQRHEAGGPHRTTGQLVDVRGIVSVVRRHMAAVHHPDRGGDVRVMAAVNDTLDRVAKMAGVA